MKSFLPDKLYDILSYIALIALDALGLCYKTISLIWHLPYGNEILATCTAISLCLGTLIGISKAQYKSSLNADIKQIGEEVREEFDGEQADNHE